MTRSRASQNPSTALSEETLVPLGTGKVQADGTARYIPYPQPFARFDGVEPTTEVSYVRHSPTESLIILPPDLSYSEFRELLEEE
jgi:hypothetical protein